ncbi:hypothetical protein LOZ86_03655 [Pectobacterium parvum]|uniref:Uncharacterized protein n=1 Tax=Pectobacterium parvum TaxID=2778550 RepID=A0AAP9IGD6_9GAMM|nr:MULTISPECIES: hypothetical protein [Pectobacterium]GKW43639.1 hypothetical protein PEC301879_34970 [Pectobacterium carotovorum subsp. carotovorum]MCU1803374.1 hypothetical protein [Pectobacterium parvum]QHQ24350.1 hypothetical protein GMX10_09915 [Pectobacterium parvum]UFK39989.1 hypothetical protein LOZ86_03655 [Pectobacterium parvum]UVD98083.1 hypothetical protein NV347_03410 [Pectobacterium parvum]
MLKISFFTLFIRYLKASTVQHPDIFGLKDFSPTELVSQGYELVGDPTDFHFYEKDYVVGYHNKKLNIVFKRYFYLDENAGNGFSIGRGASLISLLRCYKAVCLADGIAEPVFDFYFSEDKKEGAVIVGDSVVIRFNQWSTKGQYSIVTIESDFSESALFSQVSTNAVKSTLRAYDYRLLLSKSASRSELNALSRLAKFLSLC